MKYLYRIQGILLLLIFGGIQITNAQDIIQTKKNKFISCQIMNVSETSIIYIGDSSKVRNIVKDSVARFYVAKYDLYKKIINNYPDWETYYDNSLSKIDVQAEKNKSVNSLSEIKINISYWTGEKYSYDGKNNLKFSNIKHLLESCPESKKYVDRAKPNKVLSFIFGAAGGFCAGYYAGGAISGKQSNEGLLFAGLGGIALSIPFYVGYATNMKKAVAEYNKSIKKQEK